MKGYQQQLIGPAFSFVTLKCLKCLCSYGRHKSVWCPRQVFSIAPQPQHSENEYCALVCKMLQCNYILECNHNVATDYVRIRKCVK
jgi:hypothetical protein